LLAIGRPAVPGGARGRLLLFSFAGVGQAIAPGALQTRAQGGGPGEGSRPPPADRIEHVAIECGAARCAPGKREPRLPSNSWRLVPPRIKRCGEKPAVVRFVEHRTQAALVRHDCLLKQQVIRRCDRVTFRGTRKIRSRDLRFCSSAVRFLLLWGPGSGGVSLPDNSVAAHGLVGHPYSTGSFRSGGTAKSFTCFRSCGARLGEMAPRNEQGREGRKPPRAQMGSR